jgi:hypothetical protein
VTWLTNSSRVTSTLFHGRPSNDMGEAAEKGRVGEKEEVGEKGEAVTRYMRDQVGRKSLMRLMRATNGY